MTHRPYLIAVILLYVCFSTNIDVLLFVKEFFCSSDNPTFFVFRPEPGPVRVRYEGFYSMRGGTLLFPRVFNTDKFHFDTFVNSGVAACCRLTLT